MLIIPRTAEFRAGCRSGILNQLFFQVFKIETGQTFINYLTDVRLQHSVQLLENTALRVQTIAQQVGYYNAAIFHDL